MNSTIAGKLADLGLSLPPPTVPVANFVPSVRAGKLLFISGQINARDDAPAPGTMLGQDLDVDEGKAAARSAALALMAQIAAAATADFARHPEVANGASDLIVAVFAEAGRHARTVIGVASLRLGAAVEVDGVIELKE